ncbi:MAG: ABC transporter ATP-binding protein [Methylocystaceae bacterium]
MGIIEAHKLTKSYGKARGIEEVSFEVEAREIFGFIGPNGAGKSTTIRTLLSLLRPTSGEARIFGQNCAHLEPEIFQKIGYLPAEVFYYDRMRVIDLLKYSASFYPQDCSQRLKELSDLFDLDLKRRIDDLSYGNKKKVGIVQGLLHQPELLILDEPTSGLDPLMQQKFFDLLEEENQKGTTIFFSSHILSEVERLCDRVAIIKEGRIIKLEKISTLRENSHKKFLLETAGPLSPEYFQIEGVSNLLISDRSASFIYRGNLNVVMKLIAGLAITNIHINEPELEEIFLHYYEKEG